MERVRVTNHHADGTSETTYLRPASGLPDAEAVTEFAARPGAFWGDTRTDVWRARLARPRVRAAIATGAALAFGLGWLFWSTGASGGASVPERAARTSGTATPGSSAPTAGTANTANPARLTVHVAGAVKRPGVIILGPGARVIDALEATGGATANADLTHLNLAAPLTDGVQVLVVRVGEPGASGLVSVSGTAAGGGTSSGPVNLNTATVADLDALPGIGPSRAQEIVREREAHGPYRSVDDLQRIKGLGAARIAALRDRVTV